MDHPGPRLLTIGEFSRLARLSVRMLRHYDAHGLLHPAEVAAASGHRRYAPAQLLVASRIRMLRDLGCSVAQIGQLLPAFTDPHNLRLGLEFHRAQLVADAAALQARLGEVDRLITRLTEAAMPVEVRRTVLPSMTVAALRDTIPSYADEGCLWERLMPALHAAGVPCAPDASCGATYHDEEYRESDVDVEVWMQVPTPFESTDEVACRTLPEQPVACAVLHGPYEGTSAVCQELGTWVSEQNLPMTGPMVNIYRVGPGQSPDPSRWVTEVCLPVGEPAALER